MLYCSRGENAFLVYEYLEGGTHQSKTLTIRSEYITIRPSMILLLLAEPDQAHKGSSKSAYLAAGFVLQIAWIVVQIVRLKMVQTM
ncbi:hypothetical protein Tco_0725141, partial [Tanacetum coccineum]